MNVTRHATSVRIAALLALAGWAVWCPAAIADDVEVMTGGKVLNNGGSWHIPMNSASSKVALFSEQRERFSVYNKTAAAITIDAVSLTRSEGIMDEEFTLALVERVTDTIDGLLRVYLEAGGDYFDMIELSGDDYATQTGMAMSPKMFRSYFKPSIKRFVNTINSFNSEIKVMLHCDGDLTAILPDIIECGVDVLHPLEPVPSVDFAEIKANFGDALAFLGAIDIVHALPGSHQDVIDEVKRRIHQLASGGGFVIAPANHVQSDVPPENLVTLFNAAEEHGRYPIQL